MSNPLFHGTIEKTRVGDWVQAISQFGDEAIVQINENGWRAKVSDASNVAFTDAMIDVNGFGVYDLDAESNEDGFVMGLNLERFGEVINMAASGTAIEFTCPTVHKMEIVAGGVSYTLQGINTDTIPTVDSLPEMDHTLRAGGVDMNELSRAVKACDMVGKECRFLADFETGSFEMVGAGDTDDVEADLTDMADDLSIDESVEAIYAVGYMDGLTTAVPKGSTVALNAKSDYPLHVSAMAGDDFVQADIMLAPRLEG